jgi:deoxyribose-phosphate aldolase
MRASTASNVKIKAAGGIRTLSDFMANYQAGADRQGSSSTAAIVEEALKTL